MRKGSGVGPASPALGIRSRWRYALHALALLAAVAGAGVQPGHGEPLLAGSAVPVRAQLTPRHATVLSSEIAGKISALPFREGERFREGDEIAAIDCATYEARLDLASAKASAASRKLEAVRVLDQRKAVGRVDVDVALSEFEAAEAERKMARTDVGRCSIRAPFSGQVAELRVKRFQSVGAAEPVIEVLDASDLEIEMLVPSSWLSWLASDAPFTLTVEELQRDYAATVTRIVPRIDPVSQTVKIFGRVNGAHPELLAGMSGIVQISQLPAGGGKP